jgi:hypothetical protein
VRTCRAAASSNPSFSGATRTASCSVHHGEMARTVAAEGAIPGRAGNNLRSRGTEGGGGRRGRVPGCRCCLTAPAESYAGASASTWGWAGGAAEGQDCGGLRGLLGAKPPAPCGPASRSASAITPSAAPGPLP